LSHRPFRARIWATGSSWGFDAGPQSRTGRQGTSRAILPGVATLTVANRRLALNGGRLRRARGGLGRVAGAVSSHHLRRWLVAIVMIVGVAAAGGGRSGPSTPTTAAGDHRSADMAASVSGWSATHGIMPVQPKIEAGSAYERGVRVKLPVLVGAVAAALLAAVPHRCGFRRLQSSRLPLALRTRSLPLRAPPLLLLG
jgi:hypothetical protein